MTIIEKSFWNIEKLCYLGIGFDAKVFEFMKLGLISSMVFINHEIITV